MAGGSGSKSKGPDAGGGGKGKNNKNNKNNNGNSSAAAGEEGSKKLKPATAINVRHILNEKHSAHLTTLTALQTPGAKFDEVARTHSEDKARQGGSLGWQVRGALDAEFEKIAYALPVSSSTSMEKAVTGVVKTGFGWHVIMVEGRR